jgi:hypothetical protein
MRIPRVRFTVRRLMVIVAVAGVSLAILMDVVDRHRNHIRLQTLSQRYLKRAFIEAHLANVALGDYLSVLSRLSNRNMSRVTKMVKSLGVEKSDRVRESLEIEAELRDLRAEIEEDAADSKQLSLLHRRQEFHAEMRKKYERASDRAWLPVAPDPPMPE